MKNQLPEFLIIITIANLLIQHYLYFDVTFYFQSVFYLFFLSTKFLKINKDFKSLVYISNNFEQGVTFR